jgi:hypothetical protein
MEEKHTFGVKHQSPFLCFGISLFRGCFFAVFALALPLLFLGCEDEEEGGSTLGGRSITATFARIEPVKDDVTTTTLLLVFDRDILGLKKEHITISSEKTHLQNITVQDIGKTDERPGFYTLALAGIDKLETELWPVSTFSGEIAVTVGADSIPGYHVANSSYQTAIHVVPPRRSVQFSNTETSGATNKNTTRWLTIHLNPKVDGLDRLDEGNVLLSVLGDTNKNIKTNGDPEKINEAWKVPVTGIDAEGTVTVTLTRNGYRFEPASAQVQVHYVEPVKFDAVADGDELLAWRTTKLALTFDKPVDGLALNNITIAENGTGAAADSLKGSGKNYTLTLKSGSVATSGKIGVTIATDKYEIASETVQVPVYDAASNPEKMLATGGAVSVIKEGDVYYELHKFTPTADNQFFILKNAPAYPITAQVLVVGGGGGGGQSGGSDWRGGGGGGGAVLIHNSYVLTALSYPVTVGGGGPPALSTKENVHGINGGDSIFGKAFLAKGGGGGGSHQQSIGNRGASGGSGGGSGADYPRGEVDTTSIVPAGGGIKYGHPGAGGTYNISAGGGGGAGTDGDEPTGKNLGAKGGIGVASSITGVEVYYGGGGTGGSNVSQEDSRGASMGNPGSDGTGDGGCGGGGSHSTSGSKGGSGVVIVRFPINSAQ